MALHVLEVSTMNGTQGSCWRCGRRAGFTLIELLVVVSIIALLVSILLPALGKAREQARKVMCMTRPKDIGVMMQMYNDEHDRMPPNYIDGSYRDNRWPIALSEYYGRSFDKWVSAVSSGDLNDPYAYLMNRCPEMDYITEQIIANIDSQDVGGDVVTKHGHHRGAPSTGMACYAYSVHFRQHPDETNPDLKWSKLNTVDSPATLPLLTCNKPDSEDSSYRWSWGSGCELKGATPHPDAILYGWDEAKGWNMYGPAPNHQGSYTIMFADGHTEAIGDLWPYNQTPDSNGYWASYFHPKREE